MTNIGAQDKSSTTSSVYLHQQGMYSDQEVRSPFLYRQPILKSLKMQHTEQKIRPNPTEQHDSLATLCASQMVSFPVLIGSKAEGQETLKGVTQNPHFVPPSTTKM